MSCTIDNQTIKIFYESKEKWNSLKTVNYNYSTATYTLELPVLAGDVIQPIVTNSTASDIVYVDDLLVILQ